MIRDRLSWMRFFSPILSASARREHHLSQLQTADDEPHARSIDASLRAATARARLSRPTCEPARRLTEGGGRIVDAALVPAPQRHNTEKEKAAVKANSSQRYSLPGFQPYSDQRRMGSQAIPSLSPSISGR